MDISDIERTIVSTLINELIVGVSLPGQAAPSNIDGGPMLRIYRGWPNPDVLDDDLGTGENSDPNGQRIVNVTVFPVPGMARILPTRQRQWITITNNVPSIVLTTVGNTVTISGIPGPGQVCGIAAFPSHVGPQVGYAYRLGVSDTLSSVATGLASLIPGATSNGAVVSLPEGYRDVSSGSVADQTAVQELRQQSQDFLVTIWAPNPALRDTVASAVDITMAEIDRFQIGGATAGPVTYRSSKTIDTSQTAREFRRDLTYSITYPTVQTKSQPSVLFPSMVVHAQSITVATVGPIFPSL